MAYREMAGRFSQLKRIVGLFSVLSMLATSIAACACSHHGELKRETGSSCHSHAEAASKHDHRQTINEDKGRPVSDTGCSCGQAAPRVVFKQDRKQQLVKPAVARSPLADHPEFVVILFETLTDNFDEPSFSQSLLRNSTRDRAPPRPKFV